MVMITSRLGPLGMNQGTRKPTKPQKTLITTRGTVRPVYAMVAAGGASPRPAASRWSHRKSQCFLVLQ